MSLYGMMAIIIAYSSGCKKADIQFGDQFIDAGYTNVVVVDTLTPVISTVFRDSIATSQTSSVLIGSYKDPYFGKINANTFFVLSSPSANPEYHVSAMYDSLELQLRSDSSFYGDTSVLQKFTVNRLTSMIELPEGSSYLFNSSNFPAASTPLGSADVRIRPSLKDSVKIKLSNALGQELWSLLQSRAVQVATAVDFEHYFNGIKISTGNVDAAILGFSDSITMRLFYHEVNPYVTQKYIDFTLTARNRQFNQISFNRSGTALDVPMPQSREIPSETTGNTAYTQSLTGTSMKVTFPSLRSLLQRSDYVKIIKAEMTVPPLKGSYNPFLMPPPLLQASVTTSVNNELGGYLALNGATGTQSAQTGNLSIDWLYGETTTYSYDLTSYLQQEIALSGDTHNGLIFLAPSPAYSNRFNRLVVGNKQNPKGNIKLKVYYVSVQQE